jgi:TfoX C-terminal domain.
MGELAKLPNIGKEIERQLNEVGITDVESLREEGSINAWLKIRSVDTSACLHRLYSLEGAVRGIRKKDLPQSTKDELKAFYNTYK